MTKPSKHLFLITFVLIAFFSSGQESKSDQKYKSKAHNHLKINRSETISFKGKVVNRSQQGISFVNIGIQGTLLGAAADENGYFHLVLPKSAQGDSVTFSCIGYQSQNVRVDDLKAQSQIVMVDQISKLEEIEVKSERITALDVIKKVIENIPDNYVQGPYTQMKVHRKKLLGDDNEYYVIEKLEESYDDNGYKPTWMYGLPKEKSFNTTHQCRVGKLDTIKGQVDSYKNYDRSWSSHTAWSDVVDMRNNNFLSKSKLKKYDFQFNTQSLTSKDTIYIDFNIDKPSHRSTTALYPLKFFGTILINANDYSILEVQSTIIVDRENQHVVDIYEMHNRRMNKSLKEFWWEKEIVRYKKVSGKYFFSELKKLSNWILNTNGYDEILGLDVKVGFRESERSNLKPKQEYNLANWEQWIEENR